MLEMLNKNRICILGASIIAGVTLFVLSHNVIACFAPVIIYLSVLASERIKNAILSNIFSFVLYLVTFLLAVYLIGPLVFR